MNNERNDKLTDKAKEMNINYHAPWVFAIPRPYEDDYKRNNAWYAKMLKLEKKTGQIKEKVKVIAVRNAISCEITRQMIENTITLNNKFVNRAFKR